MGDEDVRMISVPGAEPSTSRRVRNKPGWEKDSMRPPWWPKKVPWISWAKALQQVVINCYEYYGREDLSSHSSSSSSQRKIRGGQSRQQRNLKVLEKQRSFYTDLIFTTFENIIKYIEECDFIKHAKMEETKTSMLLRSSHDKDQPSCESGIFLNLIITNSGQEPCRVERRIHKGITIHEFKNKLELLTGGNLTTMSLEVYDKNDKLVCRLEEGQRLLGSYPIDNGTRIHVIDNFSCTTEDLNQVKRFEISEEEYAKKTDTVKAFLESNKLGKYNEEDMRRKAEEKKLEEEAEERLVGLCKVGDRCEVSVPNQPRQRATILYVGKTDFKDGWWVGVKYDEPLGKNDGSVSGKRYFKCAPKYGGFVKPAHVKVGDFPEEDFNLDEAL